jgi:hypothetical protein
LLGWRECRRWRGRGAPPEKIRQMPAVRDTVFRLLLAALALQMLLFGTMRVPAIEQYFFGTYPVHVLLAWVAVEALGRLRLRGAALALYGSSLAVITLGSIWQVHRTGWNFGSMVPKLKDQVAVVRELNRYSDASALNDVALYQHYPKALYALRLLLPPPPDQPRRYSGRLVIRYRKDPGDPADRGPQGGRGGTIEVVEVMSDVDVPPGASRMALTGPTD